MPRPTQCRNIAQLPGAVFFKPRGVPLSQLDIVQITIDEFEALRLADLLGLYQEEAAARMGVSRQTFGRIIESARRKVVRALAEGLALEIAGGAVAITGEPSFACGACGRQWAGPSARDFRQTVRHVIATISIGWHLRRKNHPLHSNPVAAAVCGIAGVAGAEIDNCRSQKGL
jgi:uncharacterized protein